jgi:hypothetical protein
MPENLKIRAEQEGRLSADLRALFAQTIRQVEAGQTINWNAFNARVETLLREHYERVFIAVYLILLGGNASFDLVTATSNARQFAKAKAFVIAGLITTTISGDFREAGMANGGRVTPPLAVEILGDSRAENVAITETTSGIVAGEIEAEREKATQRGSESPPYRDPARPTLDDLPGDTLAIWHTERDDKVCKICSPLHLKPISEWRDKFPNGPPAHPRCRCWLTYERKE